jgi:hypothetical protein
MATLQFLYPIDPFAPREPDEAYAEEYAAARAASVPVALYSHEDLVSEQPALRSALLPDVPVVLRGWMLPVESYAALTQQVADKNAPVLASVRDYRTCHHLPGWYDELKAHTPDTVFADENADFASAVAHKAWNGYFVKDYVKSLSTGRGSTCTSPVEIESIVRDIRHYRGCIEGGVAIRELESFRPDTEERYFVFRGKAFARDGQVPALVEMIAQRIDSPFFSVDTVMREDLELRVVELGDGQVSDRKRWPVGAFLDIFSAA